MTVTSQIIVALDVPSLAAALALVDQLPQVSFWKVGLELFINAGPEILQALKARGKRVFLDLKFHDISNTMAAACETATNYGVDIITVHGAAGKAALVASVNATQTRAEALGSPPPLVLAITLLTSIPPQALAPELKIPLGVTDYALQMALLARDSGLGGVVCSPQEVSHLRRFLPADFALVCPGVRPVWTPAQDQQRTLTPAQAFQAGATYLVVGRPVTTAPDPVVAFQRICDECVHVP